MIMHPLSVSLTETEKEGCSCNSSANVTPNMVEYMEVPLPVFASRFSSTTLDSSRSFKGIIYPGNLLVRALGMVFHGFFNTTVRLLYYKLL